MLTDISSILFQKFELINIIFCFEIIEFIPNLSLFDKIFLTISLLE